MSAALAVVHDPHHRQIHALLDELFTESLDHQSVREAPERLSALSANLGGLRPGQRMYTLRPEDDPLLLALWWPWNNGTRFSLRVGCHAAGEAAQALDPATALKASFEL